MSVSPKLPMIDLEKGRQSLPSSSGFTLPQRRRKLITIGLLLLATICFVYISERNASSMAPSSWKWVKDSMRPASEYKTAITDALKDTSPPVAAAAAEAEAPSPLAQQGTFDDQPFEPTPALVGYASKMNTAIPKPEPHSIAEKDGPSKVDQILLFLTAMKKPDYRVPVLQVHRMEELQPSSTSAFIHSLHKIQPGDKEDEELYTKSVSSWRSKHRAQSPLTVFSKSYCPYSKRAKALLKEMGAQFEVYEVDLRDDAQSLQAGLKELSTHATFPTIFAKEDMIGGYDDIARLQRMGVLKGVLEGAGVKFS